jgi:hypothetical protein
MIKDVIIGILLNDILNILSSEDGSGRPDKSQVTMTAETISAAKFASGFDYAKSIEAPGHGLGVDWDGSVAIQSF